MVTLESLVPADHLLRKIGAVIDFTFIRERVVGLYCPGNNRPALDPVVWKTRRSSVSPAIGVARARVPA